MNVINTNTDFSAYNQRENTVSNVETYWGYIIRERIRDRSVATLKQWTSAFFGVSLLAALVGFWILPGSLVSQDVIGFKLGLSAVMGAMAFALLWFASYGTNYEVQIDLARKEMREVLRTNRGAARIMNRVKFEDIDAVHIARSADQDAKSELLVRMATSSDWVVLACDYEEHLLRLHGRVSRDVLGGGVEKAPKPPRGFRFEGAKGLIAPLAAA